MHRLRALVREREWIHTGIGLAGNLAFVVGSVLFLWERTTAAGVWLFIVGSALMLLGGVGEALEKLERRRGG